MSESWTWQEAPLGDYGVIGDPIRHSMSPQLHQCAYEANGLEFRYHRIQVPQGDFAVAMEALASKGYRGLNVTLPLKVHAAQWAKTMDDFAKACRASNCLDLVNQTATNTDGQGFWDTAPAAERILILGAGGSARAVIAEGVRRGFDLTVWNRTSEKALGFAKEFGIKHSDEPEVRGFELVVNTTSATIQGEPLAIRWDGEPGACVDLMVGPSTFLEDAMSHGWQTADGRAMLVEQAALSFEWWTGKPAPREPMRKVVGL